MSICYAINLDIVSSCMVFSYLYPDLSIYYKFESIILIFFSKKNITKTRFQRTHFYVLCVLKKLFLINCLKNMNQPGPLFSIGIFFLKKTILNIWYLT